MKTVFKYSLILTLTCSSLAYSQDEQLPQIQNLKPGQHLVEHIGTSAESALVRWDLIDMAKDEIVISTHILAGDDMSVDRLLGKLYRKKLENPNIKIKLLWDDWEASKNIKKPMMEACEAIGIEMYRFRPKDMLKHIPKIDRRTHDKIFAVDRKWSVGGDKNLHKAYYGLDNNSFIGEEVIVYGPEVGKTSDHVTKVLASDAVERVKPKVVLSEEALEQLRKNILKSDQAKAAKKGAQVVNAVEDVVDFKDVKFPEGMTKEVQEQIKTLHRFAKKSYIPTRFVKGMKDWKQRLQPVEGYKFWNDTVELKGKNYGTAQRSNDLVSRTHGKIYLQSPYIVLTPEQKAAYRQAAKNGAEIIVATGAPLSNDMAIVGASWPDDRKFFQEIGATVYELEGKEAHDLKALAVDAENQKAKKLLDTPKKRKAAFNLAAKEVENEIKQAKKILANSKKKDAHALAAKTVENGEKKLAKIRSYNPELPLKDASFKNIYKYQLRDPKNIVEVEDAQHNKVKILQGVKGEPDPNITWIGSNNEDAISDKKNMEVGHEIPGDKFQKETIEEFDKEIKRAGYVKTVDKGKVVASVPNRPCHLRVLSKVLRRHL